MSRRKTEAWLYVDKKGRSLLFRNKEAADFQMAEHGGRLMPLVRRDPKAEAVELAAIAFVSGFRIDEKPDAKFARTVAVIDSVGALLASRKAKR